MFVPRPARDDDYASYARLWLELEIAALPFAPDVWTAQYRQHTIVLETVTGELVGYALALPLGMRGDVLDLVVERAWRSRGAGRCLMTSVAAALRDAGCREWRLVVRPGNANAIALYRTLGMTVLATHAHELEMGGAL